MWVKVKVLPMSGPLPPGAAWLAVILVASLLHGSSGYQGDLRLVDNGYEGLVVAISDKIPQDDCSQILHGLKNVLRVFSQKLMSTTGGRASLRAVTIALPRSWRMGGSRNCSVWGPLTTAAVLSDTHIHIYPTLPLHGDLPWTQQSQGCGRPGDFIQIGGNLLKETSTASNDNTARLLLAEWVKFRWGIFTEHGYRNDTIYPETFIIPETTELQVNGCRTQGTDIPFCTESDHRPEAPNKHNAQCVGRAAWDIIKLSQDFRDGSNRPSKSKNPLIPSLRFVQPGVPRIMLVVEDTSVMNVQHNWEFMRKAVRRLIVYDLPDGAHIGIVVFNSVATTTASISEMDSESDVRQRIGSSLPRNPSKVPENDKCLLCGLQEALKTLDSNSASAAGAAIVLITTGSNMIKRKELDKMIYIATQRGIRIEGILYPFKPSKDQLSYHRGIEDLVAATHGSTFYVIDEGFGKESKMSMMMKLMEAFLASVTRTGLPRSSSIPLLIFDEMFQGNQSSLAHGNFIIDDSIGSDVRFSVYYYDIKHVGNTIQLSTPSGKTMDSINMQEEDGDANVIFVNIESAERGEWRFQIENHANSNQGLHIQITAKESKDYEINVRLWTSISLPSINMSDPARPVILYAEVKNGMVPILNANVKTSFQYLGNNYSKNTKYFFDIDLFDNGFGDPDITGGDGVYSRYMPYLSNMHLESGLYDLRIYVNNYQGLAEFPVMQREETINNDNIKQFCCSNTIEYPNLSPLPDFMRSYLHGAIELQYNTIIEDLVPPTRILDLRAQVYSEKDKAIIRWTSPGNDYDWGRAYLYEAVLAETWIKAKAFIGERIVSMPMPESVGTDQSVTVHMEQYGEIVFIAIRAVDEAGNRGGVSNIAILSMVEPVSTTVATSTSPQPMEPASSMIEPLGYGIKPPVPQPTSDYIVETTAIVIGSVTGVLTITAAVTIFCFLHVFGRRNHRQLQSDDKNDSNQSILKETDSPHEQADGETHELLSSKTISCINILAKDQCTLSPISAWNNPGCVDEPIKDSVLVHNPQLECKEIKEKSQNPADVFPDVTNTQSCSFLSSQIPFSMPVNFSSYQAGCTSGVYTSYPYSYSTLPCCAHERIMPISSAGPSSYPCHAGGSANSLPQSGLSCSTENVHSCSLENLQGQSMLDQSPSLCIGYAQSTIHSQPEQINMVECRNVPISSCTQAQHVNKPSLLPKPPYSPKLTRVQKLKQEELPKVITSSTSVPKEPVHRNVTQV